MYIIYGPRTRLCATHMFIYSTMQQVDDDTPGAPIPSRPLYHIEHSTMEQVDDDSTETQTTAPSTFLHYFLITIGPNKFTFPSVQDDNGMDCGVGFPESEIVLGAPTVRHCTHRVAQFVNGARIEKDQTIVVCKVNSSKTRNKTYTRIKILVTGIQLCSHLL